MWAYSRVDWWMGSMKWLCDLSFISRAQLSERTEHNKTFLSEISLGVRTGLSWLVRDILKCLSLFCLVRNFSPFIFVSYILHDLFVPSYLLSIFILYAFLLYFSLCTFIHSFIVRAYMYTHTHIYIYVGRQFTSWNGCSSRPWPTCRCTRW